MSDVSDCSLFGRVATAPTISLGERNDRDPPIVDVNTPDLSFEESEPLNESRVETSLCGSNESQPGSIDLNTNESESSLNGNSANSILNDISIKNVNRLVIGTLNIKFYCTKV